jgi:hypothetical protein
MPYRVIYIENGKRYDSELIIERRPVGHVRFYEAYPKAKKGPHWTDACDIEYQQVNP